MNSLKSVLLILCSSIVIVLPAQESPEIDSLKQLLTGVADSQNAAWLMQISRAYSRQFLIDSSVVYAHKGIKIATSIGDERNLAFGEYMLGRSTMRKDPKQSLHWYNKALDKFEKLKDWEGQAWVYVELGTLANMDGKYDDAIELYKSAADFVEKQNTGQPFADYLTYLSKIYTNIGLMYGSKGDYETALTYLYKSEEIAEKSPDRQLKLSVLINQANILRHLNKDEKVKANYLEALQIAEEIGNQKLLGICVSNLGNTFIKEKNYDEALKYFNRSLTIAQDAQDYVGMGNRLINIGLVHLLNGDREAAINHLEQAVTTARQVASKDVEVLAMNNLSEAYRYNGEYNKAIDHAQKALLLAREMGRKKTVYKAYHSLHEIYQDLGDFEKSLENYKAYVSLKDSLLNEKNLAKIEELSALHESEKKEREIEALSQQTLMQQLKLRQKNLLMLLSGVLILLIAAVLYFFYRQKRLEEKQKLQESRQKQLQSQINPHFLFNALASIQNYLYESQDNEKAAIYLTKFSKLMRQILENSRADFITLEQEINTLKNYLDIQKVRFNDAFTYSIYTDPQLDLEETMIPPMLAQPFIENALEHGQIHKSGKGKVEIRFEKNIEGIELIVQDNGIGRAQAQAVKKRKIAMSVPKGNKPSNGLMAQPHHSLAIKITKDRLLLLHKKRKKQLDLEITDLKNGGSENSGTKVRLQLPLVVYE